MRCPNVKSKEWKKLVKELGETNAYRVFLHNNKETPDMKSVERYIEHYRKFISPTQENAEKLALGITGIRKHNGQLYITKHGFITALNGINRLNKEVGFRMLKPLKLNQNNRELWTVITKAGQPIPEIEEVSDTEFVYKGDVYPSMDDALAAKTKFDAGIFYQTDNNTSAEDPKVTAKLKDVISEMGIDLMDLDDYKKRFKKENVDTSATALADMLNRVIAVKKGSENRDTLPEELSHFILYTLKNDDNVKKLLRDVHLTETWNKHNEEYRNIYGSDSKVRLEILGKLLGDSILRNVQNEKRGWQRALERIWNTFLDFFTFGTKAKERRIRQTLDDIATDTLSNDSSVIERVRETRSKSADLFFQINPDKFANSKILNNMKKELDDAISTIEKKIKIAEAKGLKTFSEREKNLRNELIRAKIGGVNKNGAQEIYITKGIVTFISHIEAEANGMIKRLASMREAFVEGLYDDDLNGFSKLLSEMNTYISVYGPIVDSLLSETNIDMQTVSTQGGDTRKHKELMDALNNINAGITSMNEAYKHYGKNIFISAFRPFLERRSDIEGKENADELVEKELERLLSQMDHRNGDISWIRRNLNSMAESTDEILGLTDRLVKEEIELSNLETERIARDLLDLDAKLKEKGETTDFMYEKVNGNPTGFFISPYNMQAFNSEKTRFFNELHKEFGLSEDTKKQRDIKIASWNANKQAEYDARIKEWFENNTVANPEWKRIRDEKRQQINEHIITEKKNKDIIARQKKRADEIFNEWFNDRYVTSYDGSSISMRHEFAVPSGKYINGEHAAVMNDPLKKEYYNKIMQLREGLTAHMNDDIRNSLLAPQVRKDVIERMKSDPKRTMQETLKDTFIRREDDIEFGDRLVDEKGERIKRVPIFYFKQLENPEDLSTDLTATMTMFADMANRHRHMNRVLDIVEIGADILKERTISRKLTGDVIKGGRSADRLRDYIDMVVYGEMKDDEGNLFGTSLDQAKVVDALNSYTAMNSLALNVYAGIQNITLGNILVREEAFAKEYVTQEDLSFARKTYWSGSKGIGTVLKDIGKTKTDSKLRLFFEHMDVLQDFEERSRSVNTDRSRYGRLFNRSALFMMNHIGEHQMQGRMALALANNKKVKDAQGNIISFYEAFNAENNRLTLMEGVTDLNGKPLSDKDIVAFKLRLKGINQRLHGIYNVTDKSAIQKTSLGRAVLLFRKWLIPGFNRRFDKRYYNYSIDADVEGSYRTAGRFMVELAKELKRSQYSFASAGQKFSELQDWEKANIRRTIVEGAYFIGASIMGSLLASIAGDSDDWYLNMLAYQAERLSTEIGIYVPVWNLSEAMKIAKSPAAAVNQVDHLLGLVNVFSMDEDFFLDEYERGRNAGKLKIGVWAKKSVPLVDTIEDWFHPDERLKFFAN